MPWKISCKNLTSLSCQPTFSCFKSSYEYCIESICSTGFYHRRRRKIIVSVYDENSSRKFPLISRGVFRQRHHLEFIFQQQYCPNQSGVSTPYGSSCGKFISITAFSSSGCLPNTEERRKFRRHMRFAIPLLDSYLYQELLPVFVFSAAIMTMLGVSVGALSHLIREVAITGLPLQAALSVALLQVPRFVLFSLPAASLAATLVVLSRLESDSELTSLAACGVSCWRLLVAPLGVALMAASLALCCSELLVPLSGRRSRCILESAVLSKFQSGKQENGFVYNEYSEKGAIFGPLLDDVASSPSNASSSPPRQHRRLVRVWHADQWEGGQLTGLTVLEIAPGGDVQTVATSDWCVWDFASSMLRLGGCTIVQLAAHDRPCRILQAGLISLPMPAQSLADTWRSDDASDLSRAATWRRIRELEESGRKPLEGHGETDGTLSHGHLSPQKLREILDLKLLLYQKDAKAFECVVYAMVGASSVLATSHGFHPAKQNSSRGSQTVNAFALVLLYHALCALGVIAVTSGMVSPWMGVWLPSAAGFSIGPIFLAKSSIFFQDRSSCI